MPDAPLRAPCDRCDLADHCEAERVACEPFATWLLEGTSYEDRLRANSTVQLTRQKPTRAVWRRIHPRGYGLSLDLLERLERSRRESEVQARL